MEDVQPMNDPTDPKTAASATARSAAQATSDARKPASSTMAIAPTRPTGQKRSLERGKHTRKKNPGKRASQGG
jgi:hypothetical protein